jgi:PAS domain S-box-containing protein
MVTSVSNTSNSVPAITIRFSNKNFIIEKLNKPFVKQFRIAKDTLYTGRNFFEQLPNLFNGYGTAFVISLKKSLKKCIRTGKRIISKPHPIIFLDKEKNEHIRYYKIEHSPISKIGNNDKLVLQTYHNITEQVIKQKNYSNRKNPDDILKDSTSRLLSTFIKDGNWQNILREAFAVIGPTANVDRVFFFSNHKHPDDSKMLTSQTIEWAAKDVKSELNNPDLQNIDIEDLGEFIQPLKQGKPYSAIINEMPEGFLKQSLQAVNVQSILALPVFVKNEFFGFIGFDDCKSRREWTNTEVKFLHTITKNLAHVIERSQNLAELEKSRKQFESVINNLPGITYRCKADDTWTMEFISSYIEELTGYPADDFIENKHRSILDIIHPDDRSKTFEVISEIEKNRIFLLNYRMLTSEKNWIYVEETGRGIFDENGNLTHVDGVIRDVTEKVLKEKQSKLLTAIRNELSQTPDLNEALSRTLMHLMDLDNHDIALGEAWLSSIDNKELNLAAKYCRDKNAEVFFHDTQHIITMSNGEGLPGITRIEKKFKTWSQLNSHQNFVRSDAAKKAGLVSGYGVPIFYHGDVIAVFTFFTKKKHQNLSNFENILQELNEQIGIELQQKKTDFELNQFFELVPDLMCIAGIDGYFKKINPAFKKLLGYTERELLEKPISYFVHPDDVSATQEIIKVIAKGEPAINFENRYRCKNGSYVWLAWNTTPSLREGIMYATAKNITELKKSKLKLQKAYDQLKNAQKIAKIGYWKRDLKTNLSVWSDQVYEIYELNPDEFVPTQENILNHYHPDDRHLVDFENVEYNQDGDFETFEHRIITGTGKTKWVSERFMPKYNDDGELVKIEGIIQDIAEIKEKKIELQISKERFELALRATNERIWDWDIINDSITRSPGYYSIFGYEIQDDEPPHDFWFDKIHPDDREGVIKSLFHVLHHTDQTHWENEYRFIKANGEIAWIVDRGFIIRNEEKEAIRIVGAVLDVTESRKLINEIEHQNKVLREIAWTQSHVIRAPLARLMGLTSVFNEVEEDVNKQKELLQHINNSAKELDCIIRDVINKTEQLSEEDII